MMAVAKLTFVKALLGNLPYLIGDSLKAIIAVGIAKGVHNAYPALLPASKAAKANLAIANEEFSTAAAESETAEAEELLAEVSA
jgi:hypothetical protein